MPDALPDATLPISRLGIGSTNGSNNGGGWGLITDITDNSANIKTSMSVNTYFNNKYPNNTLRLDTQ
jgi:hypothetical protein